MGDPAGCGPQITAHAWHGRRVERLAPFYVVGDPRLYAPLAQVETIDDPSDAPQVFTRALPVLPLMIDGYEAIKSGLQGTAGAPETIDSIKIATNACLTGQAAAMVTNPISKAVLYRAGFTHPGHTEFIASLCARAHGDGISPVMMLVGGGLRVALATIHVPLLSVAEHLTADHLRSIATITHHALIDRFGIAEPRLAFSGLNPHAGEDGTIGTEERDIINPIAQDLRAQGINISDARPGDTVFHEALSGAYDAVIAMTHDQGLIPVKTLDMWGGVNTTLGLPIIRTSPDHGTAYDAAANQTCRPDSLIAALKLAQAMSDSRARTHD